MGDVPTHAEITAYVTRQLQKFVPTSSIPTDDYPYVELGNFLTDVCQFRDPPSYHKAREVNRKKANALAGRLAGMLDIDGWADDLFGTKSKDRHGSLARFFRGLVYGATHQIFGSDGLPAQARRLGLGGNPTIPERGLPPAELDRIFADRMTQYYPHEHLDDLPVARPEQRKDALFQPRRSKLIGYLEWYLQYVAEELAKLEYDWVRLKATGMTDRGRHDLLARLGHLLHAVEDHFFHSNTTEVHQWQVLTSVRALKRFDPATPDGRKELFERGLLLTQLDQGSVPLRRALQRRLRYPVYDKGVLSTKTSEDGIPLLFTGAFGDSDINHTLGGALEAIETELAKVPWDPNGPIGPDPRKSELVLIRLLFDSGARQRMVDGKQVDAMRDRHAAQLVQGLYPPAIEAERRRGRLCVHAATIFTEIFEFDRRVEEAYGSLPGPGGALISLLGDMQRERHESAERARSLGPASIMDPASDNGVSAEDVGTHSLLSKDSKSKEPMRPDAMALASHASATVATLLLRRVESNVPVTQGIDWPAVLTFLVRYPKHPSARWEEQLLKLVRNSQDTFQQPDVDKITEQPTFPRLGPAGPGRAALDKLRGGTTREKLEAYYAGLESDPP